MKEFLEVRRTLNPNPLARTARARFEFFVNLKKLIKRGIAHHSELASLVERSALRPAFGALKKMYPAQAVGMDFISAVWKLTGPARAFFFTKAQEFLAKQVSDKLNDPTPMDISSVSNFSHEDRKTHTNIHFESENRNVWQESGSFHYTNMTPSVDTDAIMDDVYPGSLGHGWLGNAVNKANKQLAISHKRRATRALQNKMKKAKTIKHMVYM